MNIHAKSLRPLAALIVVLAVVAAACTSAAPGPSAQSSAPITVVQAGQVQPAAPGATASGWATAEAARGQLTLFKSFDSSGPAAWDPVKHPTVFVSSMS